MVKGFVNIVLVGGPRDTDVIKQFPVTSVWRTLSLPHDIFIETLEDGSEREQRGKISDHWSAYTVDIYDKDWCDQQETFYVYQYNRTEVVYRCTSKTSRGQRCRNEVGLDAMTGDGQMLCQVHELPDTSPKLRFCEGSRRFVQS